MARAGETLTASTSGIADADGLDNAIFAYQWMRDDADLAGETAQTYELTDDDVGKAIRVRVTFTDDSENEESLTSAATDAVAPPTAADGQLPKQAVEPRRPRRTSPSRSSSVRSSASAT